VVQQTLGKEFSGVLVSDCLNIYDGLYARQHKCYAHHLKVISAAQAEHEAIEGAPSGWLGRVRVMLKAAMGLKAAAHQLPAPVFRAARKALEAEADRLLASHRADPHEQRVANRLSKQREHLFVFLDHPAVPATNNRAERGLRPAVIRRKLSAGNRTGRGARTWEILASLAATYAQQGRSFLELLTKTARFDPQHNLAR